ncbi:MAG: glycoside hydrolase family 15 protein [Reyranella sp.]|uniref:glycoside hydrolase family 15 protein n=1 Tax=Reyranella sp. TaxID=1929291 RepID=UPI003D12BCCE
MNAPIESYGLIGDCHTAALVGGDGSIDWLCWPRFDSDACFAALLGKPSNGRWLMTASDECRQVARRYRPGTLILETTFRTETGTATLVDFMLVRGTTSDLIRLVRGDAGEVHMCMELVLRFGYGLATPWVSRMEDGTLRAVAGPDMTVLRTPVAHWGENFKTAAHFTAHAGQTVPFVLSYCPSHLPVPEPLDWPKAMADCEGFWRKWTARTRCSGEYVEAIQRSLITLKALTFVPSGGIVAAPTTSLPERAGGKRNWDYRYCWIRDSTLTLLALMDAGVYDEAAAWRDWLQRAVAGSPAEMQIMYGLMGERRLTEWEVAWLPGYLGSKPVRIGNAAHLQFQLDVYGELMDTFAQARKGGLAPSESGWALQRELVKHVGSCWKEPDNGIWESRGPLRHFTYSKVMAWVTFDRAIEAVEQHGLPGPIEDWRRTRAEIHEEICDLGFDCTRNSFRAAYGETTLDASLLLLAQVGFIAPSDPRYRGTVEAIERALLVDGFVRRYNTHESDDGLEPGEGVFLACSFWLADAYVSIGRHDEARKLFERLLLLRNDLGLLAEEYDTGQRRLIGNYPQAFSHVGLINTAFNLTRATRPAEQRAKVDASEVHAPQAPRQPEEPAASTSSRRPAPSSGAR